MKSKPVTFIKNIDFGEVTLYLSMFLCIVAMFFSYSEMREPEPLKRTSIMSEQVSEKYPTLAQCMNGHQVGFSTRNGMKLSTVSKNPDMLAAVNAEEVPGAFMDAIVRVKLKGSDNGSIDVLIPDTPDNADDQVIAKYLMPLITPLLDKAIQSCKVSVTGITVENYQTASTSTRS